MNDRKKIFEIFDRQEEFTSERVKSGIEANRKGYAEINLKTADKKPARGAKIEIAQKTHEFKFGANLFMLDEFETEEKNTQYRERFAELFNMATLPFYWDATEPEKGHTRYAADSEKIYRRPPIDLCIEFCERNGIEPREHALAYEHFFPAWLENASVREVKFAYEKRCREIAEHYADKIPTIEVTNEMFWRKGVTTFYNQPDFIEFCFKTAEKFFPSNELSINEGTDCVWSGLCRPVSNYYSYIENSLLKGARIDAIGLQAHMWGTPESEYDLIKNTYNPKNLYKHMDFYAQLGKPLQITEITIPAYSDNAEDEEIQAKLIEKLYSVWFSHENVEQIIYWNLIDGYAYVDSDAPEVIKHSQGDMTLGENRYYGGLLRFDMSPKPAYDTLRRLIKEEWSTKTETFANDGGQAEFKGFFGEYEIKITYDGKQTTHKINLSAKSDNIFEIEI